MKHTFLLLSILFLALFLRVYNLMFDAPYFFDPDERNMANSIFQMRLPSRIAAWPSCIWTELIVPLSDLHIQDDILVNSEGVSPGQRTAAPNPSCNLNPHFFAYGQFPLYLSFFSDQMIRAIPFPMHQDTQRDDTYASAVLWLRVWSAFASLVTVGITYLLLWRVTKKQFWSGVGALLVTCTPSMIQSAHFGTTESLLSMVLIASLYCSYRILPSSQQKTEHPSLGWYILLGIICAIAVGTKLTGLFCLVPVGISACIQYSYSLSKKNHAWLHILFYTSHWLIFFSIFSVATIMSSPYNMIDFPDFKSAVFGYEKDVAMGTYKAFYTRQFEGTIPIFFQIQHVFPYALGIPLFFIGTIGCVGIILICIVSLGVHIYHKNISRSHTYPIASPDQILMYTILVLTCVLYMIPNAWLYVKWTRFMTPILPLFSCFATIMLFHISMALQHGPPALSRIYHAVVIGVVGVMIIPGIAFFSLYLNPDVRVTASYWIYDHIPTGTKILYDTGNVIDIPLGLSDTSRTTPLPSYGHTSFDFYHLDENPALQQQLLSELETAEYIFVPSRRIFANHMRFPHTYPITNAYYTALFDGSLGYEKVAEFSSFPSLGSFTFPDEQAEETFTVFDHPVVRIYKKVSEKSASEYKQLLQIE